MTDETAPGTVLRQAVAEAMRLRRRRDWQRQLAHRAPRAAAICLALVLLNRLAGGPVLVSAAVVLAGLAGVVLLGWLAVRETKNAAAVADADANLGGELQSAHWFVERGAGDRWTDFHVGRAAQRTRAVRWASIYPGESRGRAWLATAGLLFGCVAASLVVPSIDRLPFQPNRTVLADDGLTPEEQAQIEAWLASLDPEDLTLADAASDDALATAFDINMDDLSPALRERLQELAQSPEARAALERELTAGAAEPSQSGRDAEDFEWAAEEAAAREANAKAAATDLNEAASARETQTIEAEADAAEGGQSSDEAPPETGRLTARETAGAPETQRFMEAEGGPPGGDSGPGEASESAVPDAARALEALAVALRQERVRAHADATGETSPDTETRRTGEADSALGFEGGSRPAAGRSRSVGAPPTPDARRPLVFDFFTREP